MIKTIAHLADIHIRKLHRFVEYRQVFKKLYKQLKELKPDAIYIGGDVVHGKLDTSPEEVRMVANFFLELCKIAPTIIIPGNHDCNLNNKSREDTLSPIVDLVKKITPNLFLKAPNTWRLRYINSQGNDHEYLNRFKECAMMSSTVNYTPDGSYATYSDGSMVSYQLTVNFQELEPVLGQDYDELPDDSIGF